MFPNPQGADSMTPGETRDILKEYGRDLSPDVVRDWEALLAELPFLRDMVYSVLDVKTEGEVAAERARFEKSIRAELPGSFKDRLSEESLSALVEVNLKKLDSLFARCLEANKASIPDRAEGGNQE